MSATFIGLMVITMFVAAFTQQRRIYRKEQLVTEMQQNIRFAMETISRDIRMAGYGLSVPQHQLNSWVSWIPNFHQNPMINSGTGSNPDSLTIVAAFDAPVATLTMGAAAGTQQLKLTMINGRSVGDTFGPSDRRLIFVGKSETLRIVSHTSDGVVVSAHPSANGQGMRYAYAAGTPVEILSEVHYEIMPDGAWGGNFPFLARIDSMTEYNFFRSSGGNNFYGKKGIDGLTVSAAFIEDLRFQRQSGGIEVMLRARTSQPDGHFVHPTFEDPYRRMTLTSLVRPRN